MRYHTTLENCLRGANQGDISTVLYLLCQEGGMPATLPGTDLRLWQLSLRLSSLLCIETPYPAL